MLVQYNITSPNLILLTIIIIKFLQDSSPLSDSWNPVTHWMTGHLIRRRLDPTRLYRNTWLGRNLWDNLLNDLPGDVSGDLLGNLSRNLLANLSRNLLVDLSDDLPVDLPFDLQDSASGMIVRVTCRVTSPWLGLWLSDLWLSRWR